MVRCSYPLQFLVVSLLPFVSTLLSNWSDTVSSTFFDTQVVSVSVSMLAVLSSSSQRTQLSVNSYLSRILPAALRSSDPRYLSSHSALSSYELFAAHSLATLSLRPMVQALGSCPASWVHGLPPCPHPSEGVG